MRSHLHFTPFNPAFIRQISLVFLSGVAMGLTPAPVNAWFLAWVALIPLWMQLKKRLTWPQVILNCLVWGTGYHGLALFGVTGIHPMTWLGVPWLASLAITAFCWLFITLWGAALVIVWGLSFTALQKIQTRYFLASQKNHYHQIWQILSRVLIGTALWCLIETIWSYTSLDWTSLSYTQSPYNLAILHLGQVSGPKTVTAVIVAVNALIAETITVRFQSNKLKLGLYSLTACLLIFTHAIGFLLYTRPLDFPPETALKIGVIQGNIPNEIKLNPVGWRKALEGYTTGYVELAKRGVDAVLTPETALPFLWTEENRRYSSFYQAILEQKVTAWVGAFGVEGESLTNSLFTITGTGQILSRYDKVKLVPLGEFIPFSEVLGKFIDRLSPLDAHLIHGSPNQVFETPFGRAIVGICYDSAFPEIFRRQTAKGGEFILTASNDAHYSLAIQEQHHAQDLMRAIESDRWTVRATNTGISSIITPHGQTIWKSRKNTYEIYDTTIYRRQTQTFYGRWGDWLTPSLLGLSLFGIGLHRVLFKD